MKKLLLTFLLGLGLACILYGLGYAVASVEVKI